MYVVCFKRGTYPRSMDFVGLPVTLSFSLQQVLSSEMSEFAISVGISLYLVSLLKLSVQN